MLNRWNSLLFEIVRYVYSRDVACVKLSDRWDRIFLLQYSKVYNRVINMGVPCKVTCDYRILAIDARAIVINRVYVSIKSATRN